MATNKSMRFKEFIKNHHLIAGVIHQINRRRLQNQDFTIFSQNCFAGHVYHILGQQFKSPTINLRINTMRDYYKFLKNLDHYLATPLRFVSSPEYPYPVAYLDDIFIHFNHYASDDIAREKWEDRKKRINFNNVYVIATDFVSEDERLSKDELLQFSSIPCNNLIIFTQVHYDDIPYCKYVGPKKIYKLLRTSPITGLLGFEYFFDYVKWLNKK